MPVPGATRWRHPDTPKLFRLAYNRSRVCTFCGCICLTLDEQTYQRRVLQLTRAWAQMLKREKRKT